MQTNNNPIDWGYNEGKPTGNHVLLVCMGGINKHVVSASTHGIGG
jgi:NAD(P)H-dependent FMN reductase